MKKTPRDFIILHKCTINDNHMIYGSWEMKHKRHNFLSLWTIFYPFTLLTQKIKILKKWEKHLEICTKNHDYMLYYSWDMALDWCKFYFSFWAIFQRENKYFSLQKNKMCECPCQFLFKQWPVLELQVCSYWLNICSGSVRYWFDYVNINWLNTGKHLLNIGKYWLIWIKKSVSISLALELRIS